MTADRLFLYSCNCQTANCFPICLLTLMVKGFKLLIDWASLAVVSKQFSFVLLHLFASWIELFLRQEKDSWLSLAASRPVSASQLLVSAWSPTGCQCPAWVAGWCQTANWPKPWSLSAGCFSCMCCVDKTYVAKMYICTWIVDILWHTLTWQCRTPIAGKLDFISCDKSSWMKSHYVMMLWDKRQIRQTHFSNFHSAHHSHSRLLLHDQYKSCQITHCT